MHCKFLGEKDFGCKGPHSVPYRYLAQCLAQQALLVAKLGGTGALAALFLSLLGSVTQ